MTNEEIIKGLNDVKETLNKLLIHRHSWMYQPIDEAIKTLEQKSCDDYISRNKVLEGKVIHQSCDGAEIINSYAVPVEYIEQLPSIQPKPKTGHWEQYGNSWEDKFKCSECGKEQPKILCGERIIGHWSDYCPNCGADMRESEDKK